MHLDSYRDAGVVVAADLVNEFAPMQTEDAPRPARDAVIALSRILAIDAPSVAQLRPTHVPGFTALAAELRHVFADLKQRDPDTAATRLNELLAKHPAHPHLAKEGSRWRLHHHPADAALLPMWTAICAEGLASMIGNDNAERAGTCDAPDCGRVYIDVSKNGSRRFCSITCQNRVKAATFRQRMAQRRR